MHMIKVLIAEDSATTLALLTRLLASDPEIEVAGQATDGQEVVEMATHLRPDLIVMDVVMPDMDGLEATRQIMARFPTPILIVTAHADSRRLNVVFEAMKAGALDVMAKPNLLDEGNDHQWGQELVATVKTLVKARPRLAAGAADGAGGVSPPPSPRHTPGPKSKKRSL
jgi:two-component system chemotaxis response regulator CheB